MHRLADRARTLPRHLLVCIGMMYAPTTAGPARAAEPAANASPPEACGLVREFEQIPNERDAYPVDVLAIDSSPQDLRDYAFTLHPGPHSFELIERIPQDKLSPGVQRALDESIHKRNLTIDVKANTVYVIGAKQQLEHLHDPDAYWAPVIYQESGKRCSATP